MKVFKAKQLKCPECDFQTKFISNLNKHKYLKHAVEKKFYNCENCSYKTYNKYAVRAHIKTFHSKVREQHKCKLCSFQTGGLCLVMID